MCLDLPVHESLPLLSIFMALSLSWNNILFFNGYPCSRMNIASHIGNGTYSLVPTISASVLLLVFNRCLFDRQCTIPCPKDITPPVWLFISLCTPNAASTQTYNSSTDFAPINLTSALVFRNQVINLFNFFQSSTSLFDTRVIKNATAVSMSGLDLFVTCSSFATIEWNTFAFSSSSFSASSFTFHKWFAQGEVTSNVYVGPNISNACSICSCCCIATNPSFRIFIWIPRKSCASPRVTASSPKCSVTLSMISVTTFESMCDILLSSTWNTTVHCFSLTILFATHVSYGLISKPMPFRVFTYKLYHNIADSMHP